MNPIIIHHTGRIHGRMLADITAQCATLALSPVFMPIAPSPPHAVTHETMPDGTTHRFHRSIRCF